MGPPGWGLHGALEAAQGLQAAVQGVKRGKPELGCWAIGRGSLEGRPSRQGLPAQGEHPGQNSRALLYIFGRALAFLY